MTLTATQRLQEWRNLGMSDQSITDLINGLMSNKINNNNHNSNNNNTINNMLLCLEIKKQLN